MHTLLFDIDGTLIRTAGAGFHAMRIAMKTMFDIDDFPEVPVHGRTDHGIIGDIFRSTSIEFAPHFWPYSELYWQHLPDSLMSNPGGPLPGIFELLTAISQEPNFAVGVLTGNGKRAAEIKLRHFELDSYFSFGGYGDHHGCRNEVARLAHSAAAEHLRERFDPGSVWVIGDTIHDIACARSIGAKAIAVETGGGSREELAAAGPDAQFQMLEAESFLALFD